ncbi:MAG: hypothetical protein AAF675_20275 [Pseudomonadota bacterium]
MHTVTLQRRGAFGVLGALMVAGLGGCFRPMLAEGGPASEVRGRIALPPVQNRISRVVNDTLENRLGAPQAGETDFRLEVGIRFSERGLLVTQDSDITRVQMTAVAEMRLYRNGEVAPVLADLLSNEAGFDETASLYASRTARRDVEERLARALAERIALRVLARAERLSATG